MIDEFVKEEIATREATAMGLDQGDTVIRRRLRQKLEFLAEESVASAPPTDAEIEEWVKSHPGDFGAEIRVSLRQVTVRVDRRGPSAQGDAARILARLKAAGPAAPIDDLGDATMLPAELPLTPLREVGRTFGDVFAGEVAAVPPGEWTGPLKSPYGLHLVLLGERVEEKPSLAMVRPAVEREIQADRQKRDLQALYEKLLRKYSVTIETPKEGVAK